MEYLYCDVILYNLKTKYSKECIHMTTATSECLYYRGMKLSEDWYNTLHRQLYEYILLVLLLSVLPPGLCLQNALVVACMVASHVPAHEHSV